MQTDEAYQKLLDYAFRALGRRRHSIAELEKKLSRKDIGGKKTRARVISRLKELKYLDDYEFAKSYVQSRTASNPRGRFGLKYELRIKGVPDEMFEKAWKELALDEVELARMALEKKKRLTREKLFYYLSSRGFSADVISRVVLAPARTERSAERSEAQY